MNIAIVIAVSLAFCIASGILTMRVATSKGYRPVGWFFVGFFFWIPALIAVAGIAPRAEALSRKPFTEMDDYDLQRALEDAPQG